LIVSYMNFANLLAINRHSTAMKHLLLSLLLTLPLMLRAQSANPAVWCPAGATWTYGYALFTERGTVTVRYSSDVMIAGQSAQVLQRTLSTYYYFGPGQTAPGTTSSLPDVVTRVVGNRVEVQAYGQFYTLYDFGAPVGSTWLTPLVIPSGPCPQTSGIGTVHVDSVGTQQVNGRTLRWFRARLTAPAGATYLGYWPGRIYEQLGNVATYMQPQAPGCPYTDPGYIGPLTTFQATGWRTISYNSANGTLLGSTQARADAAGFSIYPNPSAGAVGLKITLPAGTGLAAQLRLLDLAGRVVLRQQALGGQVLDVRGLAAGIYSLELSTPGAASLRCRVVLE
jgi:hypothetical protein